MLGVARTASAAEIKRAYRRLARELHPDRRPDDPKAEERFKRVSQAYQVLGDAKRRALYDEFGPIGLKEGFDPDAYRSWQGRARKAGFRGNLEDLFRGGRGAPADVHIEDLFGGRVDDVIESLRSSRRTRGRARRSAGRNVESDRAPGQTRAKPTPKAPRGFT